MPRKAHSVFGPSGKDRISREIALTCMDELLVHDDGIKHHGGVSCLLVGPLGSGKTTLQLQLIGKVRHTLNDISKHSVFMDPEHYRAVPETVISRGRRLDYFTTLLPDWAKTAMPDAYLRPIIVHWHKDDELELYAEHKGRKIRIEEDGKTLAFRQYSNAHHMVSNIVPKCVNVIYEPRTYELSIERVWELYKKLYQDIKDPRIATQNRRKRVIKSDIQAVAAPSSIWWFEFLETLLEIKKQDEFYSVFLDEAHEICPASVASTHWHLTEWFSNSIIDTRRRNISLYLITHAASLLDYRVIDRMLYYIWFTGSRPPARCTILRNRTLPAYLEKGEIFIEKANTKFGFITFPKTPQAPVAETVWLNEHSKFDQPESDQSVQDEA